MEFVFTEAGEIGEGWSGNVAERMIQANGVELCTEPFGVPANPPILLIMGIGGSMLWWDEGFCRMLADGGLFAIRYDHRDTGRSVTYPPGRPGYTGADLVADAVGVLDAYDIPAAHVLGQSAGGAFAQLLALDFPERVLSLVLISTSRATPGDRNLPPPTDDFRRFVSTVQVDWSDKESVIEYLVGYARMLAGGRRPFDEAALRDLVGRDVDRARDFAAAHNHDVLPAGESSSEPLSLIAAPTLVVHGAADPMFPVEHGEALADEIPSARHAGRRRTRARPGGSGHGRRGDHRTLHRKRSCEVSMTKSGRRLRASDSYRCNVRSGLFLPPFDELADPALVARLATEAEDAGWHGFFIWDHVRWREPVAEVADAWITLAAIATSTARIRLGPMVTPLARRRPVKVAKETSTLDIVSGGRLTLGVGLGSDEFGSEFSITGEELDDRRRAQMLDESLEILQAAWSGEPVRHRGEHYTIDGMRFLPRPVQRPGIPVWVAGFYGKPRPLRRAARHQGFFPVNLEHPDQLAEIVTDLNALRRDAGRDPAEQYDVVAALPPGTDPAPYAEAGATWWLVEFPWDAISVDRVRGVILEGPAQLA